MTGQSPIKDVDLRLRAEWATTLGIAISECRPDDASLIMSEALQGMETLGPRASLCAEMVQSDADFWASIAPQHELQAYTLAGLKCLTENAIGRTTRIRLMALLWNGMTPKDRAAFLDRVDGPS